MGRRGLSRTWGRVGSGRGKGAAAEINEGLGGLFTFQTCDFARHLGGWLFDVQLSQT